MTEHTQCKSNLNVQNIFDKGAVCTGGVLPESDNFLKPFKKKTPAVSTEPYFQGCETDNF